MRLSLCISVFASSYPLLQAVVVAGKDKGPALKLDLDITSEELEKRLRECLASRGRKATDPKVIKAGAERLARCSGSDFRLGTLVLSLSKALSSSLATLACLSCDLSLDRVSFFVSFVVVSWLLLPLECREQRSEILRCFGSGESATVGIIMLCTAITGSMLPLNLKSVSPRRFAR